MKYLKILLASALLLFASTVMAKIVAVKIYKTAKHGQGEFIGTVTAKDTDYGLLLTPHLKDLSPGLHGFHVHAMASCKDEGMSAGGHLDPYKTNKHLGPYDDRGHLGDLPALYVSATGTAILPILAPRLTVKQIIGHALMIHAGGDNYSDTPEKLGGGGARIACGVVQ